jgi:hypothetical protein
LVINPELSYVHWVAENQSQATSITLLSPNPELMIAQRFATNRAKGMDMTTENPELSLVRRYSEARLWESKSTSLSTNPELMLTHRYEEEHIEK